MFDFYPALPQLVDYHQTMVSVVVPKPSSIDVRVCVLLYCFSSSSFFLQRDNQYHPYPLSQVRHISYQLIKAVKCKELFVFVQSYNGGGRVGQGGRAEGMRSGRERESEERKWEGERRG